MEKQSRNPKRAAVLFGLVIFFLPFIAGAQGAVTLSLENDRYAVGDRFTLQILVEGGDTSIKVVEPAYPDSLVLISPPYTEAGKWDAGGRAVQGAKVELSFRVQKPGIITLGPFEILQDGRKSSVGPKTLFLLGRDESKNKFPMEIKWILPAGPYFTGQAIPIQLQVRNLDSILKPQEVAIQAPGDSILEKVLGGGEIEIGSIGDQKFFHIPWGHWMIIPSSPGVLSLPSFLVTINGITRSTPELRVEVSKVPDEALATRAVGEFSYSIDAQQGTGDRLGELVVKQELKGTGNFPYLVLPKISFPKMRLISRQEGANFRASTDGYQGSLLVTWRFAPEETGVSSLVLPGFVWFSPQAQKVQSLGEKKVEFSVSSLPSADKKREELKFLTWDQVLAARPLGLTFSWLTLLFILPGLLFLVYIFVKRQFKKMAMAAGLISLPIFFGAAALPPPGFQEAMAAFEKRDYAQSNQFLDQALQVQGTEPGLWYNKGAVYFAEEDNTRAIYAFRKALDQGFVGDGAAQALSLAEERENLPDQIHTWRGFSSDILWIIFIAGLNGFFFVWALVVITRRGGWIIVASLLLAGSLTFGGLAIYAHTINRQTGAVLGPADSPIRRVPGELAEDWMILKRGTSLKLQGKTGEFYLVQTGYGLEGWIHQNFLLLVR